jgi:hypothetical protein
MNKGIGTLGEGFVDNLFASLRQPRSKDVVVKGAQGVLERGTLMMPDDDDKQVKATDMSKLSGVLLEPCDTTGGDVDFFVGFDCDLKLMSVFSGVTVLKADYYPSASINIKE